MNKESFDEDVQAMTTRDEEVAAAIEVDADGRVTVENAHAAAAARAAYLNRPLTGANTNCKSCNTAKGCGPLNGVKNCAAKLST